MTCSQKVYMTLISRANTPRYCIDNQSSPAYRPVKLELDQMICASAQTHMNGLVSSDLCFLR